MTKTQKYLLYGIPALAVLYLGFKALKNASDGGDDKEDESIDKMFESVSYDGMSFDGNTVSSIAAKKNTSNNSALTQARIKKAKEALDFINKNSSQHYIVATANRDTYSINIKNIGDTKKYKKKHIKGSQIWGIPNKKESFLFGKAKKYWLVSPKGYMMHKEDWTMYEDYISIFDPLDFDFKAKTIIVTQY